MLTSSGSSPRSWLQDMAGNEKPLQSFDYQGFCIGGIGTLEHGDLCGVQTDNILDTHNDTHN